MDSSSPNPKQRTLKSVVLDVRAGLASLKEARDAKQHAYLVSLLRSESVVLAEQCWERHLWLNVSDEWLASHRGDLDPDDYRQRDDQWILKLRQYQAAMDLLGQVLEALNTPFVGEAHVVTANNMAPHAQEALL